MSSAADELRPRAGKMTSINNNDAIPHPKPTNQTTGNPVVMDKYFVLAVFLTCVLSLIVYLSGLYSGKSHHSMETLKGMEPAKSESGIVIVKSSVTYKPTSAPIAKVFQPDFPSTGTTNLRPASIIPVINPVSASPLPGTSSGTIAVVDVPAVKQTSSDIISKPADPIPSSTKSDTTANDVDAAEDSIAITRSDATRRCGEPREGAYARPCANDDKMCGHWDNRYFQPTSCRYDDITPEQARQCIGSHALAFIGDNHMRDIAYAVAAFLQGETLDTASGEKVEHTHKIENNGTMIPDFSTWPFDSTPNNGYIFPQDKIGKRLGYKWQVQYWAVYRKKSLQEQALDILRNEMPRAWGALKPISLAFWSHGIHDYGWYNSPPYGEHFYDRIFGPWLQLQPNFTVPCVWASLNNMCQVKAKQSPGKGVRPDLVDVVDDVNKFMSKKLLDRKFPYWDASAVLRCPERCDASDDGMHVKMYVDIMRAKMLFNHLCDENMRWRGSVSNFM